MTRTIALALIATLALPTLAFAQSDPSHAGHSTAASGPTDDANTAADGDARAAFEAANARMHEDMAVEPTGNADVDFARSMIPHHRGAVDMARIQLENGQDPELRALAETIVEAQEAEIAQLEAWLAANAPASAPVQ